MIDIRKWLDQLGLGQYAVTFSENGIDLDVVPELTEADLKELGVLLGHRRKILKNVAALSQDASPSSLLSTTDSASAFVQLGAPGPERSQKVNGSK